MAEMSSKIKEYFNSLDTGIQVCYNIANKARAKGYDPDTKVEIPLAKDMAERVEGLVAVVAPQLKGSGVSQRIKELELQYGSQNWKIAFLITEEVAQEKFCKFENKLKAMEVALRIGLSYITNGVVSSPLEGFVRLELKKRRDDGKEYFCLYFSGPIRSAGTTATCIFVAVCDYLRMKMGYALYDPSEDEVKRTFSELEHFHDRITNLQYFPSEKEAEFMTRHLPVQIDGDPSEKIDVPNYKDLPRIATNKLRNGFCLVMAEGLCQKNAKFWGKFSKWYKEFQMDHWIYLEEFVNLQKEIKAKGKAKKDGGAKIVPDYTFIKDLVAGRPVLGYPLRTGAFRIRFGRARTTGLSDDAIHPATMVILDNFIAYGTQLKTERPGKSTVISSCDSIEGPIVKLKNGDVLFLDTEKKAREVVKEVQEILFTGDILINFGYFLNRVHILAPVGYCEEWWSLELEKASAEDREKYKDIISNPMYKVSLEEASELSRKYNIPLHPRWTYHWNDISLEDFKNFLDWMEFAVLKENKIILPVSNTDKNKRTLELIGCPHKFANNEYVVVEDEWADALKISLGYENKFNLDLIKNEIKEGVGVLDILNKISSIKLMNKSGLYMGSRMGRPEKAKMRKMTGSPHSLFPVGKEGGRLRCFQAALENGKINAQFTIYFCDNCKINSVYNKCHKCSSPTIKIYYCKECEDKTGKCGHNVVPYQQTAVNVQEYFDDALKKLGSRNYPELIKGVRGTSNKDHIPEHLIKGILRSIHNIYVNKDGTTRYDMTEMSLTHFKPKEIGTKVEKLIELGYTNDIYGNILQNDDQILELKCQDLVLGSCPESLEEGADFVLFRVANFIDDLLEKLYGLPRFYNLKNKEDLAGHLVVGLSPHTAAGIVGRIIGFSKTQTMLTNPLFHSIMRRDCFTYDTYLPIMEKGIWKNIKIGELVEKLNPIKQVDRFGTLAKNVKNYYTIGKNSKGRISITKINDFTKHKPSKILKIKTQDGRSLRITENHKFLVFNKNKIEIILASDLQSGMKLVVPIKTNINAINLEFIELKNYFKSRSDVMIRNVNNYLIGIIDSIGKLKVRKIFFLPKNAINNYLSRNSFPLPLFLILSSFIGNSTLPEGSVLAIKRDHVNFPNKIPLNENVLNIIGLYVAEGYARKNTSKKGFYQVEFSASEKEIRDRIISIMRTEFNLEPSHINDDHIVYSSRLFYEFLVEILRCGRNAYEKRIPEIIFNLPLEKLKFFLQGYFDGDGSVSDTDFRVACDSVSEGLLQDLEFSLKRYGLFTKRYWYKKKPGSKVREFYIRKNREIPEFEITKLMIPSNYCKSFYEKIGFSLTRKQNILKFLVENTKPYGMKIEHDSDYAYPEIKEIIEDGFETTYCLDVDNHVVLANGLFVKNCDGDEACVMLMMDALLNFSPKLLSDRRGATQDEPLVLTSMILPTEVDDMVFDMDIAWRYPLELYESCLEYKPANEVKIKTLKEVLGKEGQYESWGFTHDTDNFNNGVRCSSYKTLPTMQEKVEKQMILVEKLRAADTDDVARLIIERHFIRDLKGNLRKFSMQQFRCVSCNEKFRRPPLKGNCSKCNGKIIFTISQGSVIKYLDPSLSLATKYKVPAYLRQTLELTKQRVDMLFGKEKDKQEGLGKWFG